MKLEWEQESPEVGVLYMVRDIGNEMTDRTAVATFRTESSGIFGGVLYNLTDARKLGGSKVFDLKFRS